MAISVSSVGDAHCPCLLCNGFDRVCVTLLASRTLLQSVNDIELASNGEAVATIYEAPPR